MASERGLEALQISTCYKMAGRLKVVSYKMVLDFCSIGGLRPAFPSNKKKQNNFTLSKESDHLSDNGRTFAGFEISMA